MMSSKTLILVRHAHRDTSEHSRDNGLSERGQEQVKKLVKFARHRLEETEPVFFSSPKKRCVETIMPVAKDMDLKLTIDQRLTERGPTEETGHYSDRLDEFIDFWKHECGAVTIACSHGDWIPIVIEKLTGAKVGLRKCGWAEIEYVGGECFLTWVVQKHYG
jgi:broad specificity phosphatase PhoE